jgi:hypothetical protein
MLAFNLTHTIHGLRAGGLVGLHEHLWHLGKVLSLTQCRLGVFTRTHLENIIRFLELFNSR